jgi:hypothetical protein
MKTAEGMAFVAARRHSKECKRTRMDIDRKLRGAIEEWGKQ